MGTTSLVLLYLLFVETLQLISTCSNVLKSILMWNMVFWTNQGRRIVNANSYSLCLTATMVLTHQLEVLHGQLTRLSQVKFNPKQSWSSRIYCWCTKQAKLNPKENHDLLLLIVEYVSSRQDEVGWWSSDLVPTSEWISVNRLKGKPSSGANLRVNVLDWEQGKFGSVK